ncbi:histamine H3 receptor-like [Branchiostoma floridae]|uniref:Histamine H3 receptor-like n=2 Tax=Branchiostoma floridae TaxID=7739 RepID=A0A9J7L967_BRAFL|nr:histamine H3 receptor-like [Branchiostoma floridae]
MNESAENATAATPESMGDGSALSLEVTVLLAVLISIAALLTIAGNVLVIVSFILVKELRISSNYFILNLAITDFVIGVFAMPVYAPYLLSGVWKLGETFCTIWLVIDYVDGSASVLSITLISLDRYLLVTKAIKHRAQRSLKKTVIMMVSVWIIAFLLYGPAILIWRTLSGVELPEGKCYVGFHDNFPFLFSTALVEFFLPFTSVAVMNFATYWSIRRRGKRLRRHGAMRTSNIRGERKGKSMVKVTRKTQLHLRPPVAKERRLSRTHTFPPAQQDIKNAKQIKRREELVERVSDLTKNTRAREKKAARALAIIVTTFAICWAPYTITMLVRSLCRSCVSDTLFEWAFWMLWLNSMLNPFLYAMCHMQFREAFKKLLGPFFCRCWKCMTRKNPKRPSLTDINKLPSPVEKQKDTNGVI